MGETRGIGKNNSEGGKNPVPGYGGLQEIYRLGGEDAFRKLVLLAGVNIHERMGEIAAACREGDYQGVERICHRIRNSAMTLGMADLNRTAERCEAAAESHTPVALKSDELLQRSLEDFPIPDVETLLKEITDVDR